LASNSIYSGLFILSFIFAKYLALIYIHLNILFIAINGNKIVCLMPYALEEAEKASWEETNILFGKKSKN
jgi:hypothetical protein